MSRLNLLINIECLFSIFTNFVRRALRNLFLSLISRSGSYAALAIRAHSVLDPFSKKQKKKKSLLSNNVKYIGDVDHRSAYRVAASLAAPR